MRKHIARIIACLLIVTTVTTGVSWEHLVMKTHAKEVALEAASEVLEEEKEAEFTVADVTREEADLSENTAYSTTYKVGRNKKMTVFYQEPIRFQNEKGNLTEYDPTLREIQEDMSGGGNDLEGYRYENTEGDKKQYFPETISKDTPILMQHGKYAVTMTPVEIAEESEKVSVEEKQYTNAYEEDRGASKCCAGRRRSGANHLYLQWTESADGGEVLTGKCSNQSETVHV